MNKTIRKMRKQLRNKKQKKKKKMFLNNKNQREVARIKQVIEEVRKNQNQKSNQLKK